MDHMRPLDESRLRLLHFERWLIRRRGLRYRIEDVAVAIAIAMLAIILTAVTDDAISS